MSGRCANCNIKTVALGGATNRTSRQIPPPEFTPGFVIETATRSWLVCENCLRQCLKTAA